MLPWFLLLGACGGAPDGDPPLDDPGRLTLRWVRGYDGDSWERSRAGVLWGLANLGATATAIEVQSQHADAVIFTLDLVDAGFPELALPALLDAVLPLQNTEEAVLFGGLDVGRFFMKVLYEPWRYYAVTGACPTLEQWKAAHLGDAPLTYGITESMLVDGDRLVTFQPATGSLDDIAFVALDGEGSIHDGTFEPVDFDVVDILPSLQQRFAVYDANGELSPSADPTLSPAGQPGRCMWCHEGRLHHGYSSNPTTPPYLSAEEFDAQLNTMQADIDAARALDESGVDWTDENVHEWGELLVGTFLSPTAGRLSREWAVPEAEILVWLAELPTHEDEEFSEFGAEYTRADVDAYYVQNVEDYCPIATLASPREVPEGATLDGEGAPEWGCEPKAVP